MSEYCFNVCETLKGATRERNLGDPDGPKAMMKDQGGYVDRPYPRLLTALNDPRVENVVQRATNPSLTGEEVESDVRSILDALILSLGEKPSGNECFKTLTSEIGMPPSMPLQTLCETLINIRFSALNHNIMTLTSSQRRA